MVGKPPQPGTLARGWRLGKLGLTLTGSYLGYQAQNLFLGENEQRQQRFAQTSSQRVRQELGSLKGAVMKLGQLLSQQTRTLPEGAIRELAGLQMQAPAMHPTLARAQFKASLGKQPEELLGQFEEEPFVEGEVVSALLERKPPAAMRNLIGERLVELYYYQLHRLRALQADHHPGNYLFQTDGRVGLVDFGCVKRITFDASALIRGCISRSWRQGDQQAREILGLIFGPRVPCARARKMLAMLERMTGILYPEGVGVEPVVDFGKGESLEILGQALGEALRNKATNPEFAFISRADLGIYSILHRLNAKVNVAAAWRRVEQSGQDGTPGHKA